MILKYKKELKIIAIIALAILALPLMLVVYLSLPWVLLALGIWLSPNPPEPEIKYMEFPFELVYEINSEIVTVQDVFVCEYTGIDANEGQGKHREWNGYLKGTGEGSLVLLKTEDGKELFCSIGRAEYYMDDMNEWERAYVENFPRFHLYDTTVERSPIESLTYDDLYNEFGIKLISWKYPEPIKNTFK